MHFEDPVSARARLAGPAREVFDPDMGTAPEPYGPLITITTPAGAESDMDPVPAFRSRRVGDRIPGRPARVHAPCARRLGQSGDVSR